MIILLCTTEKLLMTTLDFRFRKAGMLLKTAKTSDAALEVLRNSQPDLVIVDLELPEDAAFQYINLLRSEQKGKLPIIAAGVLDDQAAIQKALRSGADDFITKPYKPDELVLRINQLLSKSAAVV